MGVGVLCEYINENCVVLIDDRGEVVRIGQTARLTAKRAEQILANKPGALLPAIAEGPKDAAPGAPSPLLSGSGAASEGSQEAECPPCEDCESPEDEDTLSAVLALHHLKRKEIAKTVTGKKLSARKSDDVIRNLTPERLAEVVAKFLEG